MDVEKANLLLLLESFRWDDLEFDRSDIMEDLILAFNCVVENDDRIFGHPNSYNFSLNWGFFHELLAFDEEELNVFTGWFTDTYQKTLINLWSRSTSDRPSSELSELDSEFPDYNNGLLGCHVENEVDRFVFNCKTWEKLHQDYVKRNLILRKSKIGYFRRLYIPALTISANQINESISKGLAHSIFRRVDLPNYLDEETTLHGEKVHMHFNDSAGSSLNIDGTWKHGGFDIPTDAYEPLEDWGFLLPE